MNLRIKLEELLQHQTSELPQIQLTYQMGFQKRSLLVKEGDSILGSAEVCDLRIKATGIRSRHARLKRNHHQLYIQPLGQATVLLQGKAISELTPLPLNQSFKLGTLELWVESIASEDQQPGVQINPISIKALLENEDTQLFHSAAEQLERLNQVWMSILTEHPVKSGDLLELLSECIASSAAALYKRQPLQEWNLLGEDHALTQETTPHPDDSSGYSGFSLEFGKTQYRLLVKFSEDNHPEWQSAFCDHLLRLKAVSDKRGDSSHSSILPSEKRRPKNVWNHIVGRQVQKYLLQQTEICHHSNTVLVVGETGTGKELAVQTLHRLWNRQGAFIALNCAAVPGELLDAELFGVESGTATGVSARIGRVEQAEGGTLFLDEISEMPLHLQSKLLRLLQEREYFPLGAKDLRKADVNIVSTSNRSLSELESGDLIRKDVYFRIAQTTLTLPPLRERSEDLAELCESFLMALEKEFQRGVSGISLSALEHLKNYSWPGNIRELQNVLRTLYVQAPRGTLIQSIHLPKKFKTAPPRPSPQKTQLHEAIAELEKHTIERELQRQPNVAFAAQILGFSEGYLYRKMKKLGIPLPRQK